MKHTKDETLKLAREWLPKAYRDGDVGDEPKFTKHNMEVAYAAGAAAEREACAKLCWEVGVSLHHAMYAADVADLIRARGQA